MSSSLRKLNDSQIEEAKKLRQENLTLKEIGDLYGVHWTTVFLWTTNAEYRNKKLMYKVKDACYKCGQSVRAHVRCKDCNILLHEECDCTVKKIYSLLIRC